MNLDSKPKHNHCSMRREDGNCNCKLAIYTQTCPSCGRMVRLDDCIQHYQRGWGHTECQHSDNEWGLVTPERSDDDHGVHCSMRREKGYCYCKQAYYSQHCQSCLRMVCPGDCIQHYQSGWGHTECQHWTDSKWGMDELLWSELKEDVYWFGWKLGITLVHITWIVISILWMIWAQKCHLKPRTWTILCIRTFRDLHESQDKRQNQWRLNTTASIIQKTVQKFQASSDNIVSAKRVQYTSSAQIHCHQTHST